MLRLLKLTVKSPLRVDLCLLAIRICVCVHSYTILSCISGLLWIKCQFCHSENCKFCHFEKIKCPYPKNKRLRNLFDDVQIEVLLSNATSRRFRPNTGDLQGSMLSPYLYSVYINQLPAQLRPQAFPSSSLPLEIIPSLNCLLYADDVVLIAERSNLVDLLRKCENHSIQMEPIQMRDFGQ